jgi:hypothetical protein
VIFYLKSRESLKGNTATETQLTALTQPQREE